MTRDRARVREDFDRIALLATGHSEDDRYLSWLLRQVPRPCGSALDLGCGDGSLTLALAGQVGCVRGIDLSPRMIEAARRRCAAYSNVEFEVGDLLSAELPLNHFDLVVAVGVLHHLPWDRGVERAKGLLRAGGLLMIVDLLREEGPLDRLLSGLARVLSTPRRVWRRQPRSLREAWAEHGRRDTYLTLAEVRRLCRRSLPGARVRRRLYWRYSVAWTKPATERGTAA